MDLIKRLIRNLNDNAVKKKKMCFCERNSKSTYRFNSNSTGFVRIPFSPKLETNQKQVNEQTSRSTPHKLKIKKKSKKKN